MKTLRDIMYGLLVAERLFIVVVVGTTISMMAAVVTDAQVARYIMGVGLAFFAIMTLSVGLYLIVGAMVEQLGVSLLLKNRAFRAPTKTKAFFTAVQ